MINSTLNDKIDSILELLMEAERYLISAKIKLRDIPKEVWKDNYDKMWCNLLQLKNVIDEYEDK